jgi:cephalosporin hydroxylase
MFPVHSIQPTNHIKLRSRPELLVKVKIYWTGVASAILKEILQITSKILCWHFSINNRTHDPVLNTNQRLQLSQNTNINIEQVEET